MRRFLIIDNYLALVFLVISGFLGALITRGQGFEIHFTVSMISLALSATSHLGSAIYLAANPVEAKSRVFLVIFNYVAVGFMLSATYAGFMIRQGVTFDYHFTIAIAAFFVMSAANILSALFLALKYKKDSTNKNDQAPVTQG